MISTKLLTQHGQCVHWLVRLIIAVTRVQGGSAVCTDAIITFECLDGTPVSGAVIFGHTVDQVVRLLIVLLGALGVLRGVALETYAIVNSAGHSLWDPFFEKAPPSNSCTNGFRRSQV